MCGVFILFIHFKTNYILLTFSTVAFAAKPPCQKIKREFEIKYWSIGDVQNWQEWLKLQFSDDFIYEQSPSWSMIRRNFDNFSNALNAIFVKHCFFFIHTFLLLILECEVRWANWLWDGPQRVWVPEKRGLMLPKFFFSYCLFLTLCFKLNKISESNWLRQNSRKFRTKGGSTPFFQEKTSFLFNKKQAKFEDFPQIRGKSSDIACFLFNKSDVFSWKKGVDPPFVLIFFHILSQPVGFTADKISLATNLLQYCLLQFFITKN